MIAYDLDDRIRLPLEVINYCSIYELEAYVRHSKSGRGFHILIKGINHDIPAIKKYSDKNFEAWKEDSLGMFNLWDKGAGEWWRIKNYGVYEK